MRPFRGRAAFRAKVIRDKLLAGVDLEKGELFETMAGFRDEEISLGKRAPRIRHNAIVCRDCHADIKDAENRMKSDPLRCKDCARAKKRAYNQAYRGTS